MNPVVRVVRSTVIDTPADDLWRLLRDFNSHRDWHPGIAGSEIEAGEPGDVIGVVRSFRLSDGSMLREQLIALSDQERELTYCLIEGPIPLVDYVASMRLRPVTDGDRSLLVWESRFRPPADRATDLIRLVAESIYEAGFKALQARFAGAPRQPVTPQRRPEQPPRESFGRDTNAAGTTDVMEVEAIVVERYGGPEVMTVATVRVPAPGPGAVRLRQTAIGVNFIDVYCRTGYLRLLTPPGVPGMEAAGRVIDVGPGVTRLRPGDRVAYACEPVGAYAEARTMDASLLVPLPDDVDDETVAAIFLKGLAAEFLLHRVHQVQAGETVVVHAAAGGTGLLLCEWASALGARVIGTVSTHDKAERALAAGADRAIVYTEADFADEIQHFTGGRGADVIYDGVGVDTFGRSLEALAVRGHLISFGQASGPVGSWNIDAMAAKSVTVSRPNFGHYTTDPTELQSMAGRLFNALQQGVITANVDRRFPLADAAAAHRRLASRENIGAIILIPGNGATPSENRTGVQ